MWRRALTIVFLAQLLSCCCEKAQRALLERVRNEEEKEAAGDNPVTGSYRRVGVTALPL